MINRVHFFKGALTALCCILCFSCNKSEEPVPDETKVDIRKVLVVYAVNNSSLKYDFEDDLAEMARGMAGVDRSECALMIYKNDGIGRCSLNKATYSKDGNKEVLKLNPVFSYTDNRTSTSPERIGTVLEDALGQYPGASYDLLFWGHGTSWLPGAGNHITNDMQKALGGEYNPDQDHLDWIGISEFTDAIPSGKFGYIWFDCCYMGNIECLYQLREKAEYIAAYPSEILGAGLPYDLVLTDLLNINPDLISAADKLYYNYANQGDPVTVSVFNMKAIKDFGTSVHDIVKFGTDMVTKEDLEKTDDYSTMKSDRMYDCSELLGHITYKMNCVSAAMAFDKAKGDFISAKHVSAKDFKGRMWNRNAMSGLSMHLPGVSSPENEGYYKTLDWYRDVMRIE